MAPEPKPCGGLLIFTFKKILHHEFGSTVYFLCILLVDGQFPYYCPVPLPVHEHQTVSVHLVHFSAFFCLSNVKSFLPFSAKSCIWVGVACSAVMIDTFQNYRKYLNL